MSGSRGGRYSSSHPSSPEESGGGEALLLRNGVAASIGGGERRSGKKQPTPATTTTKAVTAAVRGSSASSLSPLSSSSSFALCGSGPGESSPPLSAPRHGLWALQAVAVDAAGNEGQDAACALSFEKGPRRTLGPEAIATIAAGAFVVVVAVVGVVACLVRRGRR